MSENSHGNLARAVVKFAGHALAAAAIFIIVALVAFGLGKFVHFLEEYGAPPGQIYILTALEYALLIADSVLVLFFIWSAIFAAFKEMKK